MDINSSALLQQNLANGPIFSQRTTFFKIILILSFHPSIAILWRELSPPYLIK
jgi:hypothetical protein